MVLTVKQDGDELQMHLQSLDECYIGYRDAVVGNSLSENT